MKSVSAAFQTHIEGEVTTVSARLKLTRIDGTILGWTNYWKDVSIGGVTYRTAVQDAPSSVKTSSDLAVDNLEVLARIDDDRLAESDLKAGRYDYAAIELAEFNHQDTSQGIMHLRSGTIGETTVARGRANVELRGVMQKLQQRIGRMHQKPCDADLGDARCGVRLNPPTWAATTGYSVRSAKDAATGSVVKPTVANDRHFKCTTAGTSGGSEPSWNTTLGGTTTDGSVVWTAILALTVSSTVATVASRSSFTTAAISRDDGWFDGGVITWTSGLNSGLTAEVKRWTDASNTIALHLPMPYEIQVGDAFTVTAGCDLLHGTCISKFDNLYAFRGFPHMPTRDDVVRYPDAPA